MLRSAIGIAAGAALTLAVGAHPAHAMSDDVVLEAHVPFAFQVEGRPMPAGDYEIKAEGFYEQTVVEIRNTNGHGPRAFFLTTPWKASPDVQKPEILFDRIGHQRFLRLVLIPGGTGARLPVDRAEVQAARAESGLPTGGQS